MSIEHLRIQMTRYYENWRNTGNLQSWQKGWEAQCALMAKLQEPHYA